MLSHLFHDEACASMYGVRQRLCKSKDKFFYEQTFSHFFTLQLLYIKTKAPTNKKVPIGAKFLIPVLLSNILVHHPNRKTLHFYSVVERLLK